MNRVDKTKVKRSKLAIFGFLLSVMPLLSIFLLINAGPWALLALVAIPTLIIYAAIPSFIICIISLTKIKKYNLKGRGFAIAGLIISSIPIIFTIIVLCIYFVGMYY